MIGLKEGEAVAGRALRGRAGIGAAKVVLNPPGRNLASRSTQVEAEEVFDLADIGHGVGVRGIGVASPRIRAISPTPGRESYSRRVATRSENIVEGSRQGLELALVDGRVVVGNGAGVCGPAGDKGREGDGVGLSQERGREIGLKMDIGSSSNVLELPLIHDTVVVRCRIVARPRG